MNHNLLTEAAALADTLIQKTATQRAHSLERRRLARIRNKAVNRYARRWVAIGGAVVVNAAEDQERADTMLKKAAARGAEGTR